MQNQLLSSMMYYSVFNLCFHYLQLLIKLDTVLSMIQNLTIPIISLFCLGHLLCCVCVCLCVWECTHACLYAYRKRQNSERQGVSKCGLRMPGSLSEGLQGQNYFHNNTEMLFALSTVWTDLHWWCESNKSDCAGTWIRLWYTRGKTKNGKRWLSLKNVLEAGKMDWFVNFFTFEYKPFSCSMWPVHKASVLGICPEEQ